MWLTNDGIESTDACLTYIETAEILRDLAKWAGILEDPLQMADKVRALDKEPPRRRFRRSGSRAGPDQHLGAEPTFPFT